MNQSESPLNLRRVGDKIHVTDIYVIDGDSLSVTLPCGEKREVRLAGIDAPELAQKFGKKARDRLEGMVRLPAVLYLKGVDHHDRIVGEVYFGTEHSSSANLRMIQAGYAYSDPRFPLEGADHAQDEASREALGIWATNSRYVKPWTFRERSEEQQLAKSQEQKKDYKQQRVACIREEAQRRADKTRLQNTQVSVERAPVGEHATQKHLPDTTITRSPVPITKTSENSQSRSIRVNQRSKGCLVFSLQIAALVLLATAFTWVIFAG